MRVENEKDLMGVDIFIPDNPITVHIGHIATFLTFDKTTPLPVSTFNFQWLKIQLVAGNFEGEGEQLPPHARYLSFIQNVGPAADGKVWAIDPRTVGSIRVFSCQEFTRRLCAQG